VGPGERLPRDSGGVVLQDGMALAIVVWFIAGMSLLVAGIVAQARVDTHMSQVHLARAKAVAAGDGAIQLMLADLVTNKPRIGGSPGMPVGNYRVGETQVIVRLVPRKGLIDMKTASPQVLSALFVVAGGLGEDQARLLAENVLQSRSDGRRTGDRTDRPPQLDAMEDLLRVPGFTRTLLDSIRDFIVVDGSPQGTDWALVPDKLLRLLEHANPTRAEAVKARRDLRAGSDADAGLVARDYRADALVRYGDKTWLRRRWISLEAGASSALPWRVVRTEPPRVSTGNNFYLVDR
jgi:general secretion pathway protein K